MQSQNSEKKDDGNKVRYHGLALAAQGRSGIKSQSLAFQNSKWSTINPKSRELESLESVIPGMTTVYVGKIPQELSDSNIRKLLSECGNIMRWNRSIDPITKKLSSFGLCEFDSPVGVINAVNVLNGVKILGNQLLVKYQHGIDKEMSKWQNNRINDILKQRGGDCTIETVLNELSALDSRMRASINRLLVAMHDDYDNLDQKSRDECKSGNTNKLNEVYTDEYNKSDDKNSKLEYKLPVGFKKHPKEKYREGIYDETLNKFESKMKELDDEIYTLIRIFPGSMDISNNLTTDYLIEILEESYFKSIKINKYKDEMMKSISNLIDSDEKSSYIESDSEEEYYDSDIDDREIMNTSIMCEDKTDEETNNSIVNDINSTNFTDSIDVSNEKNCNKVILDKRSTSTNMSIKTKLKLNISGSKLGSRISENNVVFDPKVTHLFQDNVDSEKFEFETNMKDEESELSMNCVSIDYHNNGAGDLEHNFSKKKKISDSNENKSDTDISIDQNILHSDHWNIIFESNINIDNYKEYVSQEMEKIIGTSDIEALNTIKDFILTIFSPNSRSNIQENIKILKSILDDETENFLKGLYIKIIEG
ncbi:RNA-binding domain protein [Cryptosporidium ryanae]|uniref:RNA-binding domain protein n=1 Tax=Cryptosporidium ryanae TaxID=515981 RepID=UPI003519F64A|nr:RNA-binding domain protein [Cryptosporidium ryanae]